MGEINLQQIEVIVHRMQNGDNKAREELIALSYERMKRLARKMLRQFPSVRRWEETDDVFQRATVRLWRSLESVQPRDARHFLNLAAMQIRRELLELSRSLQGPLGLAHNQDSIVPTDTTRPAIPLEPGSQTHEASSLASWTEFHQAVSSLDDELQEVFSLLWYQGLSQDLVCQLLGTSQKTVSRRWQKAKREVYEILGKEM